MSASPVSQSGNTAYLVKVARKFLRVERRGCNNELEIGPRLQQPLEQPEQNVRVDGALVCLRGGEKCERDNTKYLNSQ